MQVNNILPDEDETMPQFGLRLRKAITDGKARRIILDLRHNNGGNSFLYVELLRTLVAFSAGEDQKVYVLIGRNVYSAAASLTTDLERLVRPVFVGEPTSGTGISGETRARSSFRTAAWPARSPGFNGSSATCGMNDGRSFRRSRSS